MSKKFKLHVNIVNGTHYKRIKHSCTTCIGEVCDMKLTLKMKSSHNINATILLSKKTFAISCTSCTCDKLQSRVEE